MTSTPALPPAEATGRLTTHVLDTSSGRPAAGMAVSLYLQTESAPGKERWQLLHQGCTNSDGRLDAPLLEGTACVAGRYRIVFDVAGYFAAQGTALPEPSFLGQVPLDFGLADPKAHYHVPLLVSPWAYSTYRGS